MQFIAVDLLPLYSYIAPAYPLLLVSVTALFHCRLYNNKKDFSPHHQVMPVTLIRGCGLGSGCGRGSRGGEVDRNKLGGWGSELSQNIDVVLLSSVNKVYAAKRSGSP
jgi:hypothetical protein